MLFGKKKTIKNGDTVIFDFAGFCNGIQFEGGTAKNYRLKIGSGEFIEGFEEQMVGLKEGQKSTINVKFPNDYGEPSLNGQPAEFKVKINKII